ncbi:unnamed protein product [Toxocara canis]|uniref:Galectin n=1 Tax=Toxocara canis TaxID=6265 RepID=A0A183VCC6_TOXCA|nr:unnamed protein product [Toxocara canis]
MKIIQETRLIEADTIVIHFKVQDRAYYYNDRFEVSFLSNRSENIAFYLGVDSREFAYSSKQYGYVWVTRKVHGQKMHYPSPSLDHWCSFHIRALPTRYQVFYDRLYVGMYTGVMDILSKHMTFDKVEKIVITSARKGSFTVNYTLPSGASKEEYFLNLKYVNITHWSCPTILTCIFTRGVYHENLRDVDKSIFGDECYQGMPVKDTFLPIGFSSVDMLLIDERDLDGIFRVRYGRNPLLLKVGKELIVQAFSGDKEHYHWNNLPEQQKQPNAFITLKDLNDLANLQIRINWDIGVVEITQPRKMQCGMFKYVANYITDIRVKIRRGEFEVNVGDARCEVMHKIDPYDISSFELDGNIEPLRYAVYDM